MAKSLTIQIKGDAKNFKIALDGVEADLDNVGTTADKTTGKFGGLADKLKGLGGAAGVGFAAVGAAAVAGMAVVAGQISKAFDIEAANDKLAAQLGATPEMAADFGRIAGDLYSQNYGESVSDVNEALKRVWQDGLVDEDATNDEIQGITARVMDLSNAFDQDLGATTRAVSQMMRTGLAGSAEEAFDVLTRGFQQGNDKSEDLLDTMNEYGTQFRQLGLNGTQAMGLISQGLKGGARDADIVADTFKEFAIRAQDGSELTAESFRAVGLNAEEMSAKIARGGPDAAAALDMTLDALRGIEDPAKRAQLAVGLFGTQSEDMQDALSSLDLTTAADQMGRVEGAASEMATTLADNAGARLESFKRTIQTNVTDFFTQTVLPGIIGFADTFQAAFAGENINADGIEGVAATVGSFAREALPALRDAATTAFEGLRTAFAWMSEHKELVQGIAIAVGGVLVVALGKMAVAGVLAAAPFLAIVAVLGAVAAAVIWAWKNVDWFRNGIQAAMTWIATNVPPIWAQIQAGIAVVVDWFMTTALPIIRQVVGWIATTFGTLVTWVQQHWGQISEIVGRHVEMVRGVIDVGIRFISWIWENWGQSLINILGAAWGIITGVVQGAVAVVRGIIELAMNIITGNWGGAWNAITGILSGVWQIIMAIVQGAISVVVNLISGAWSTLASITSGIWGGIRSVIGGVVDFIVGIPGRIAGALSGMWSGLTDGFRSALNWIIDKWNGLGFSLPTIDLGPLGSHGGGRVDLPDMPRLHTGGTFHAPRPGGEGLAILRDREYVSTPGRGGDTDLADRIDRLADAVLALADRPIHIDVDRRRLGELTAGALRHRDLAGTR